MRAGLLATALSLTAWLAQAQAPVVAPPGEGTAPSAPPSSPSAAGAAPAGPAVSAGASPEGEAGSEDPRSGRHEAEVFLGLGPAGAACDDKKPDSDCAVDGGFALSIGGAWRFTPRFAVGLEIAHFAFSVRESWRGNLENPATEVDFSSTALLLEGRWYWLASGVVDPYLLFGLGFGSYRGDASDGTSEYHVEVPGTVVPLGLGVDGYLGDRFRLGAQALAALQLSREVCEEGTNLARSCERAGKDHNALAWRVLVTGTYAWGTMRD